MTRLAMIFQHLFETQANINKAHRDRIAFIRICSGKFEAGKEVYHVQGERKLRLTQPQQMMAEEREDMLKRLMPEIL